MAARATATAAADLASWHLQEAARAEKAAAAAVSRGQRDRLLAAAQWHRDSAALCRLHQEDIANDR